MTTKLENGIATSCGQCDVPMKESEMTDTDKITDEANARYKATLDFLMQSLAAANSAAHELPLPDDNESKAIAIGWLNIFAVELCPAKLWLLEDIAQRLATDEFAEADDCGDSNSH